MTQAGIKLAMQLKDEFELLIVLPLCPPRWLPPFRDDDDDDGD